MGVEVKGGDGYRREAGLCERVKEEFRRGTKMMEQNR